MTDFTVTLTMPITPTDCEGVGTWSNTGRPAAYRANAVEVQVPGNVGRPYEVRWKGSKAGRALAGFFWSSDPVLARYRARAIRMAQKAYEATQ